MTRHVLLHAWTDVAAFPATPTGRLRHTDPMGDGAPRVYEWADWVSPELPLPFGATSLVPSWNADTPDRSWLTVEVRVAAPYGEGRRWSRWFTMAHWAATDREIHPTSVPDQAAPEARVDVDTLTAPAGADPAGWSACQLRVTLLRPPGSAAEPRVRLAAVMASRLPDEVPPVSAPLSGEPVELPVPPYSQQLHRDTYPQWDGGGASWCSPTSTTMLLAHHGRLPSPEAWAWVEPGTVQPYVVHAARHVFDQAYGGAGNWAFNTAYAAQPGVTAFVTRLRSLAEAELLVRAGVPLAATVSFGEGELTGAGYTTQGHLLTIVGFTGSGDVVCNDPASHERPSADEVRVVYDRAEFERVWLGSAGGVVYVVHPDTLPLPAPPVPDEPNW